MPLNKKSFKSSQCLPNIRDNSVTSNNSGKKQDTKALCLWIFNPCSSTILHHLVIDIFVFSSKILIDIFVIHSLTKKSVKSKGFLPKCLSSRYLLSAGKISPYTRMHFWKSLCLVMISFRSGSPWREMRSIWYFRLLVVLIIHLIHTTIGNPNATFNA